MDKSSHRTRYHRIMNSQYQVKIMLKLKAILLQKHDNELFGKKFRNNITDTIKPKRETKKIATNFKCPFRGCSFTHQDKMRDKKNSHKRWRIKLRNISTTDTNKSIEMKQIYIFKAEPSST